MARWFVYVVRFRDLATRAHVMKSLGERGIPSRPYFPPIHLQPYIVKDLGTKPGDFPVTEYVSARTLALPFFGKMTAKQVDTVCGALAEILEEAPRRAQSA